MKIKTEQLKELVSKAIQGASNDKLIPITQLMGIRKWEDVIKLTTSDGTNYFYVYDNVDDAEENINVTVYADQFSKLVSKITSEYVYLTLKNDALEVKGNGTYMLELEPDENGELIIYPDPYNDKYNDNKFKWDGTIKVSEVKAVIESVKPSLATTMELPCITNYFVGDNVIATDRYKIASYNTTVIDKEILVSAKLMDLLSLADDDIKYKIEDDCMLFNGGKCTIFSKQVDDVTEYPIDVIEKLIEEDFKSVCKVNKSEFIALLERISLFVGKYDDTAVRLYFEKDGIRVSNKNRNSNELISYIDSKKYKSYDCVINVNMLLDQLKAYSKDVVELHYNNDKAIKLVSDNVVQIVALMTED